MYANLWTNTKMELQQAVIWFFYRVDISNIDVCEETLLTHPEDTALG